MKKIKAIIFDFDGVLCNDYFYQTLKNKKPLLYEQVNSVFKNDKNLIKNWMRGKIDSLEFNKVLAERFDEEQNFLQTELEIGIKEMQLNKYLLNFASNIQKEGIKTAVLTDNMDVFQKVMVPTNKLNDYFDEIFSSFDHKRLKLDEGGKMVKYLIKKLGVNFDDLLVIDDWEKLGEFIKQNKGNFYLFKKGDYKQEFDKLYLWFKNNFIL